MIIQAKNGKARRVPITPELRAELLARTHKSGFVFGRSDNGGHPPSQEIISMTFGRLMKKSA